MAVFEKERKKGDLDVFPMTAANNMATDMIPNYRISNKGYQRVSIFYLSCLSYTHFSDSGSSSVEKKKKAYLQNYFSLEQLGQHHKR